MKSKLTSFIRTSARRGLAALVLLGLLAPLVLVSYPREAQATGNRTIAFGIDDLVPPAVRDFGCYLSGGEGTGCEANNQEDEGKNATASEAAAAVRNIDTIAEARSFFGVSESAALGIQGHNEGYDPPRGVTKYRKYRGNPWLEWKGGGDKLPEGTSLRFVLVDASQRTAENSHPGFLGAKNGVVWIFRNEYNSNLAIILWTVEGAKDSKDRFVLAGDCRGVVDPGRKISGVAGEPGSRDEVLPGGPGEDDTGDEELEKQRKVDEAFDKYGLTHDCDVTTTQNPFKKALQEAKLAIHDALGFLLKTVVSWVTGIVNIGALGDNPGLTAAWKTIRDFVNIIFILILSTIAISNILRIDTERYGIRALLPRLIFAVIAVNFSFIIMQILVNAAFVIAQPFLGTASELLRNPPAKDNLINPNGSIGSFIVGCLVIMAVIIALLILAIFFVIRIIVIWLLTALSPFVFLFMVLPLTRSLASSWWKNAIKWTFMAPVAFIILFIAAEVLSGGGIRSATEPAGTETRDADFFLKVAFFCGALIAAVMIPWKIGLEVFSAASSAAKKGAHYGRKGGGLGAMAGMAAADRIGGGDGGPTLGTRLRATGMALGVPQKKAAPGSRRAFSQMAAQDYLAEQTAQGKGAGRLTGASAGQKILAQQQAVGRYQKELATTTPAGKMRIAHGAAFGVSKNGYAKDHNGNEMTGYGKLTDEDREFMAKPFAAQAAFGDLAQGNMATPQLTEEYADSGLAQMNTHNPALASIDRNGNYRPDLAASKASNMSLSDFKGQESKFWTHANDALGREGTTAETAYGKTVLAAARAHDAQKLAYSSTTGERNSFEHSETRDQVHAFAQAGGFRDASGARDGRNQVVKDSYNRSTARAKQALRANGFAP